MTTPMSVKTTTATTSTTDRNDRKDVKVVKPTPAELMEDTGTGLDYGTRPDRIPGYLTPTDRFYIRSHAPTPNLDAATWTLQVDGNGVREPIAYTYHDLWTRFPLVSMILHDRVRGQPSCAVR
jgi:DMSO/TMAO reductase YedYZ molybdopterin-dependent catalytic subunit